MLVASACLFLALGNAAASEKDFTFPALRSQPVVIERVANSGNEYLLVVFNRSLKTIQELAFVFAGRACTPAYKPVWPAEKRDGLAISPGTYGSIRVPKGVLDGVAAGSLASCGHATPTEVGVVHASFADGSSWDLGDRVRAGEAFEAR